MSYEEKVLLNRFDSSVDKELELLSEEKLKQAKVTLLAMAEEDQNLRRNALVQGRLFTKQEAENISRSHVVKLKEIISEFGWPSHNNFGEKYAWAAFLIAQHADHDISFQKEAKNYICSACLLSNEKNLDFIKQHYAFLYDRIAINEKKEQWFGTQVDSNGHLLPIRDVKGVDERRAKLGLMPLHAYQQMMINNLKKISNPNQ
jgi:hypothetical protein